MRHPVAIPRDGGGLLSLRRARLCLIAAALAGCGATPPSVEPYTPDDQAPSGTAHSSTALDFERQLRERALDHARQGRLAEAALAWEILLVLRPHAEQYHQHLAETREAIDAAIPDSLQSGAQAVKRGQLDAATAHYLEVLALQPEHEQAAEALRAIERERNKRVYLGKSSRLAFARRMAPDVKPVRPAPPAAPLDRNELEHAALLATQGEFDDAIALVERHLSAHSGDPSACRLLADLYYQKADRALAQDKAAAVEALVKSAQLDPSHVRAAAKLKRLNGKSAPIAPVAAVASGKLGCAS